MARKLENTGFVCLHCGADVKPLSNGGYRNHCPLCLYSLHVDIRPGDRACACRGLMRPAALRHKSGKGWQLVHLCTKCGVRSANVIAQDTVQSDDVRALAALN